MTDTWDGRPQNPERDGWHLLHDGDIEYVVRWKPARGWLDTHLPIYAYECAYGGPLYSEAEVEALIDKAVHNAMLEASTHVA